MTNESSAVSRRVALAQGLTAPVAIAFAMESQQVFAQTPEATANGAGEENSIWSKRVSVVATSYGKVRGVVSGSIHSFKGIRYAKAPLGALRFKAPIPPDRWTGIFDATNYGPASPQVPLPTKSTVEYARTKSYVAENAKFMGIPAMVPDQSEDCLALNVWTPGTDSSKRPVMFRIHGGGYSQGSGGWSWHDGTNLARRGDVVVVTVNHRLTALGYLYLGKAMGDEYTTANPGMMDLVEALKWVRDNIASFGGDPNNVTIFGESGGGMKVGTLLCMPAASGLFHRAIMQSGAGLKVSPLDDAIALTDKFLAKAGISPGDIKALQEISVDAIFDAMDAADLGPGPMPCVDGKTIPRHPVESLASGMSAEIPLIIGATLHEWTSYHSLFHGELPKIMSLTKAEVTTAVAAVYGKQANYLMGAYAKAFPKASPGELFLMIEAGGSMRRRCREYAEAKVTNGRAPVFAYSMNWESGALDGMLRAAHGLCVPLTMDNVEHTGSWTADFPESTIVAAAMSEAWIAFARTGNPSADGYTPWEPYDLKARKTMLFNTSSVLRSDPYREYDIWKKVPEAASRGILPVPGMTYDPDAETTKMLRPVTL